MLKMRFNANEKDKSVLTDIDVALATFKDRIVEKVSYDGNKLRVDFQGDNWTFWEIETKKIKGSYTMLSFAYENTE